MEKKGSSAADAETLALCLEVAEGLGWRRLMVISHEGQWNSLSSVMYGREDGGQEEFAWATYDGGKLTNLQDCLLYVNWGLSGEILNAIEERKWGYYLVAENWPPRSSSYEYTCKVSLASLPRRVDGSPIEASCVLGDRGRALCEAFSLALRMENRYQQRESAEAQD